MSLRGLPLGGHLGNRVSALLDGQLSDAESERAWGHLAGCRDCQLQVERESWIKRRVAGLSFDAYAAAPDSLKGQLTARPTGWCSMPTGGERRHRHALGLAALGGSAVGAAVMGFIAFGAAPADAPTTPQPRLAAYSTTPTPPAVLRTPNVTAYRLPR